MSAPPAEPETWQLLIVAVVQGLTEFLPISSSAHLVLAPWLFGWHDPGLPFDVALHVGTLAAVLVYFRKQWPALLRGWLGSFRGTGGTDGRLAWAVLLGTVPVVVVGLLARDLVAGSLRAVPVIAAASAGFGLLLWWADARARGARDEHALTWRDVAVIGLAQALAIVPGVSRSGITITAALALGLSREGAVRFSFLLSVPVIALAGGYETLALLRDGEGAALAGHGLAAVVAGLTAYATMHFFLRLVERIGMGGFVLYRVALAGVLMAVWL